MSLMDALIILDASLVSDVQNVEETQLTKVSGVHMQHFLKAGPRPRCVSSHRRLQIVGLSMENIKDDRLSRDLWSTYLAGANTTQDPN